MASAADLLIISASTGTGHGRAAEALRQAALRHDRWKRAEHVDLLDLAPRWVRAAYGDGYELVASRAPWLWREVYRRTDSPGDDPARWGPIARKILFREFNRLLRTHPWTACVATHFLAGQLAAGSPGLPPFALVITDLTLHRFWAQPRVTRYFAGCLEVAQEVRSRLPAARVDTPGIPISPAFEGTLDRAEARRGLGLRVDAPVVVVMGGGLGLRIEETVQAVAAANIPGIQIIAICGRNATAAAGLRTSCRIGDRLRVFGFVHDVERYLAAGDLTVTKPGGLSVSEALALGSPLLLTSPIPGQEEGNARVLCDAGAAVQAADAAAITEAVERIFLAPDTRARMIDCARRMGRPRAAADVVNSVWQDVHMRAVA